MLIAGPASGSAADQAIRLIHTGPGAALAPVLATLAHLGCVLQGADVSAALAAAAACWQRTGQMLIPIKLVKIIDKRRSVGEGSHMAVESEEFTELGDEFALIAETGR